MSKPKRKRMGGSALLRHLNLQLTPNNFSVYKQGRGIVSHVDREIPQYTHLTCCGLSSDQCTQHSHFCGWSNENQICYAVGENRRLDSECHDDTFCCGQILPHMYDNDNDNSSFEVRSLEDTIGPGNVLPDDGQSFIGRKWFDETASWIMRGNKNINNSYDPVPCAIPPVLDLESNEQTCGQVLYKAVSDGNEIITMADWSHILCQYNPGVFCQPQHALCPTAGGVGDMNNDGSLSVPDVVLIVQYSLYNINDDHFIETYGYGQPGCSNYEGQSAECASSPVRACCDWDSTGGRCNVLDVVGIVWWILNMTMNLSPEEETLLENVYDILTNNASGQNDELKLNIVLNSLNRYMAHSMGMDYLSPF